MVVVVELVAEVEVEAASVVVSLSVAVEVDEFVAGTSLVGLAVDDAVVSFCSSSGSCSASDFGSC